MTLSYCLFSHLLLVSSAGAVPAQNRNKETCFCRLKRFIFLWSWLFLLLFFCSIWYRIGWWIFCSSKQNNNSPVSRFIISTSKLLSFDAMCVRALCCLFLMNIAACFINLPFGVSSFIKKMMICILSSNATAHIFVQMRMIWIVYDSGELNALRLHTVD